MEPAFQRGDLIVLWNNDKVVDVGEVVACWLRGKELPMVHRVVQRLSNMSLNESNAINERYIKHRL